MSRQTHQLLQANVSSTQTGHGTSEKTGHGLLRGNLMDPKSKACCLPQLIHLEGEMGNWSHNTQGVNPLGFQSSPGKWRKTERCWGMLGAFFLIEKSAGTRIPEVPSCWPGACELERARYCPSLESSTLGLLPLLGADICCFPSPFHYCGSERLTGPWARLQQVHRVWRSVLLSPRKLTHGLIE